MSYPYHPPPPPPGPHPSSNYPQQNPQGQYGYAQAGQHQPPRGGGNVARGGRGGFQGRADSHNSQYQQPNGYTGPSQQGPPQGAPIGYNPHNPSAGQYIGPQPPAPQPPAQGPGPQGYPNPPQWQQHGPPQNGPSHHQPQIHHPPQPAPLSAQNYHPNYAPQAYQQQQQQQQPQQQFGQQHPAPQFQVPQPQFNQSGPPAAAPQQWGGGPPQHGAQNFSNRGRGRGGFGGAPRGGHDAPLMGPPIRMGFDNGQNHMAQASSGFPPPQFGNQQGPPPQYPPTPNQSYTPAPFQRASFRPDQNSYNSQHGRGNSNFRGRGGRGDFHGGRGGRSDHHQNGIHRSPSSGFQRPAGGDQGNKKKKKRRVNTLGLTPNGAVHEESEEEDVDEEAQLVTLLGPDTPQLPPDLTEWLALRKSRFPTKARRDAAAAAALEEHRIRSARRADKVKVQQNDKTKQESGTDMFEQQRELQELERIVAAKKKAIQDAMSGSKRKRETGDEGDDDRDQANNASGPDSGSDSPEIITSRLQQSTQQPKAQLQRHCKYYSTGGICGKKGKCRFVHDAAVREQALRDKEANGGKMTLAQRLTLNDHSKDDLTILKSIKYLKEKGLFEKQPDLKEESTASVASNDDVNENHNYSNMDYGDATSS